MFEVLFCRKEEEKQGAETKERGGVELCGDFDKQGRGDEWWRRLCVCTTQERARCGALSFRRLRVPSAAMAVAEPSTMEKRPRPRSQQNAHTSDKRQSKAR